MGSAPLIDRERGIPVEHQPHGLVIKPQHSTAEPLLTLGDDAYCRVRAVGT